MYVLVVGVGKKLREKAAARTKRSAIKKARPLARKYGVVDVYQEFDGDLYLSLTVREDGSVSRV